MKAPSRTTSGPRHIVCPACGSGELWLPDLNAGSIKAAMKVVEGTARTMGIRVNA